MLWFWLCISFWLWEYHFQREAFFSKSFPCDSCSQFFKAPYYTSCVCSSSDEKTQCVTNSVILRHLAVVFWSEPVLREQSYKALSLSALTWTGQLPLQLYRLTAQKERNPKGLLQSESALPIMPGGKENTGPFGVMLKPLTLHAHVC